MSFEKGFLIASWIGTTILLYWLVPKNKIINGHISFLFMQVQTWIFGSIVVENRLLEYPIRLMSHSYRVSLTFEYYVFPAISAIFNIHFPSNKSFLHKFIYVVSFPTFITVIEWLCERYTKLIHYINWEWYWSWITILLTY